MSQQAEKSQTATAAPSVTLLHEIVTNAADIIMVELLMLHDHRNKGYWKRAMHVIWEQLTHARPLVEELPSKFTIPTHIIATKMVMRDPVVLMAEKEWLDFDKIRDAMDADVTDHPWYQIGWPVNKGPSATISLEPTTPTWQTCKQWAATRSMTPATGKPTTSATPSSHGKIFDGVVIVTPSWQQSGQQTSSPASWGAATSQSCLTTPSHPMTPNATPMEHMEEEITALQQQHMEMAQDLLDTHQELANT
ncbi:hypothetical protein M404DRAFT_25512 [Pisolithus tinctorius Marx 270]|uniref:Uncharacterized protein n=1 Tax=Pisolithus tinctorius Marx 270 TaxID=870435 RepID=A0A0C3PCF9_PISTI|nr:hypothetical protein M404DRAFT_25512 [Pisolithus tinctorius Marx 270]